MDGRKYTRQVMRETVGQRDHNMHVTDFEGSFVIATEEELLERLKSVRVGKYGAFELNFNNNYPVLNVHLNCNIAYIHYFSGAGHPGYQACDMTPEGCLDDVHFLQVDGNEGSSFDMSFSTLISDAEAYRAALEFFRTREMPPSIKWFEL